MKKPTVKRITLSIITILSVVFFILLTSPNTIAITFEDMLWDYRAPNTIPILCYHDVYPDDKFSDDLGVSVKNLEAHFQYLKDNNYNVITLDQYAAYSKTDRNSIPANTIMITFDDGYESIYTYVFPLLKKFNFPALFGIIGSWMDGGDPPEDKRLATWEQLREMEASGLAEAVSHSYDLHYYELINPHGDYFPVANSRIYFKEDGRYEDSDEYIERISDDFDDMATCFQNNLGHKPRAIIWPYGEHNYTAARLAAANKMMPSFILGNRSNMPGSNDFIDYAGRYMMSFNLNKEQFTEFVARGMSNNIRMYEYTRASQVDIDALYVEGDMAETESNIDDLIVELKKSDVNTVFLQAFEDNEGSGNITSVYFYTTHAPVKADIFSHVSNRLRAEGFLVIAWMNTLSCQWLTEGDLENRVQALNGNGNGDGVWYDRATPFSRKTEEQLALLFDDLSTYAKFYGVLFQDDLYLNDFEDFSPHAAEAFYKKFNVRLDESILRDKQLLKEYGRLKNDTMIELTNKLMERVRRNIHYAVSLRNIYSDAVLDPEAETWLAQNYKAFLDNYDYTVIMAYPYLAQKPFSPSRWLQSVIDSAMESAGSNRLDKIIVKVQTYNWAKRKWLSSKEILRYLRQIENSGLTHNAIYPHKQVRRK